MADSGNKTPRKGSVLPVGAVKRKDTGVAANAGEIKRKRKRNRREIHILPSGLILETSPFIPIKSHPPLYKTEDIVIAEEVVTGIVVEDPIFTAEIVKSEETNDKGTIIPLTLETEPFEAVPAVFEQARTTIIEYKQKSDKENERTEEEEEDVIFVDIESSSQEGEVEENKSTVATPARGNRGLFPPHVYRQIFLYGLGDDLDSYIRFSGCSQTNHYKIVFTGPANRIRRKEEQIERYRIIRMADIIIESNLKAGHSDAIAERAMEAGYKFFFTRVSVVLDASCPDVMDIAKEVARLGRIKHLDIDSFFPFDKGFGTIAKRIYDIDAGREVESDQKVPKRWSGLYFNAFLHFPRFIAELGVLMSKDPESARREKGNSLAALSNNIHYDVRDVPSIPWKFLLAVQLGNVFFHSFPAVDARGKVANDFIASFFHTGNEPLTYPLKPLQVQSPIETAFLYWKDAPILNYGRPELYALFREPWDYVAQTPEETRTVYRVRNNCDWLTSLSGIKYLGICYYSRYPNSRQLYYDGASRRLGEHGSAGVFADKLGMLKMLRNVPVRTQANKFGVETIDLMTVEVPQRMLKLEQLILVGHDVGEGLFPRTLRTPFDYPNLKTLVVVNSANQGLNYFVRDVRAPLKNLFYYDYCDYGFGADPAQKDFRVTLNFDKFFALGCHITIIASHYRSHPDYTVSYDVQTNMSGAEITRHKPKYVFAVGQFTDEELAREYDRNTLKWPAFHDSLREALSLQNNAYGIDSSKLYSFRPEGKFEIRAHASPEGQYKIETVRIELSH